MYGKAMRQMSPPYPTETLRGSEAKNVKTAAEENTISSLLHVDHDLKSCEAQQV